MLRSFLRIRWGLIPEDRRFNQLRLTDFGREKISGLIDLRDHWLSSVMSCLTEEEQRQFEDCCRRLLSAAEKMETLEQAKTDK